MRGILINLSGFSFFFELCVVLYTKSYVSRVFQVRELIWSAYYAKKCQIIQVLVDIGIFVI